MSTLTLNNAQFGQSATASNNFVIRDGNDGILKFSRGNVGATTIDVAYIDASNNFNAIAFNSLSDANKKKDIATITNAVNVVKELNAVSFKWIEDDRDSFGVIAQELEKIIPAAVSETDGVKSVNYHCITAFLIAAVQDLSKRIEELESKQ